MKSNARSLVLAGLALVLLWMLGLLAPAWAEALPPPARSTSTASAEPDPAWADEVRALADGARQAAAPDARVEVNVGRLDPRLRLAPCQKIQAYLPAGTRAWGGARIGLKCLQGPSPWNVYLPVTVRVLARSLVAARPLPAGSVLTAADLQEAEVDLAAAAAPAIARVAAATGRVLARPLAVGDALRNSDLKPRQWFAPGDTVRIVARGDGYAVSGEGQALGVGVDGQSVRVRTDSGRVVSGQAVAEKRVELPL